MQVKKNQKEVKNETDGIKLIRQLRNRRLDDNERRETRDFRSLLCF